MADKIQDAGERVERDERKMDDLAGSMERQFDDVTAALAEQRQYTKFAFDRLSSDMKTGFTRLERKLDQFITHSRRPRSWSNGG